MRSYSLSLVVALCHDKLLEFYEASCRCCTLVTLELRYRRRSLHGSRPVAEAGRTINPCSGNGSRKSCSWNRLNTGIAARSTAELFASNSFSSQWFHGNVCRSATTNRRRYCHNCCASLGTYLGSPSIVFIIQYVEVLPCQHSLRVQRHPKLIKQPVSFDPFLTSST